ncbi:MAG: helix-turn-helix domain-containing protein [Chloroflexi bacterium]|nr:helix-turn-helix domain-containing protein [Chloroflexota bacterium]
MGSGLSFSELARMTSMSRDTIIRMLRGDQAMRVDQVAEVAAVLGLQLAASLHPDGDPVRDRGQLAVLQRLRARVAHPLRWQVEVPVPIAGDRRSADAVISDEVGAVLVEAETHLHDIQALERRVAAKARDLGIERVVLLVADTRHNRRVLSLHPELRAAYPLSARACLARFAAGRLPPASALVIL